MQIRWFTFIFFAVILISSCKKEAENQHPAVTFINPSGDDPLFSRIMDSVVFRVSDDELVHRVSINFVNEELISLSPPITLNIYSKDTVIAHSMKLGPVDVEKGFILVRADDELLTKLKYQPVVLTDKPPSGEQIVFGYLEGGQTNMAVFEPLTGQVTDKQSFDYEVERLEGNTQSNFILSWPKNKRFVEVRSVREAETVWRAEAAFPQAEYVDYFLQDKNLLLADRDGNLKLHHFYTGNVQLNAKVEDSKLISAVCFDHQYLYAATKDLQTGKHSLLLFFRASGVLYKRIELAIEAQDMLPASDSSSVFLIASNETGSTQIFSFNTEAEVVELKSTITDFEFIPPATSLNELIYLRDKKKIISWSPTILESQIIAEGPEINGMAASTEVANRFYYINENQLCVTVSGGYDAFVMDHKLEVLTLIKE